MEEAEITLTWSIVDVNVIKVFSEDFQMLEISLSLGNKNIIQQFGLKNTRTWHFRPGPGHHIFWILLYNIDLSM